MTSLIDNLVRQAIEDAALEHFLRVGFEATDLVQVAEQAHVSISQLLDHYPGKEALLKEITDKAFKDIENALDALPITAAPTPDQQEHALRVTIDALTRHRNVIALVSRFSTERTVANIGHTARALHYQTAVRLGGAAFDNSNADRVRIAATVSMIGGILNARITIPLDSDEEREALVRAALAALNS